MEVVHAVSIEALLGRRPSGVEAGLAPGIVWWEGPLGPAARGGHRITGCAIWTCMVWTC
ncbi:MAG: hypothetical protein RXS42_07915 [Nitrososphaeria archaeon]